MSENESPQTEVSPADSQGIRPEELPPVEPPSAGFIIQLFLIPALIVAAVIGVWTLFGKMADSGTDWQRLVVELGSANEHRRWRSALNLAQVLRNQEMAPDENGDNLAQKPEVASAICKLLDETLASPSTLQDDIDHREFLARTLGSLKCNEIVLPTLANTLKADRDIEVRKSGMMSLALIANRSFEAEAKKTETARTSVAGSNETVLNLAQPLEQPTIASADVLEQLKLASQDEDPSIRQLAAYNLALVSGPKSVDMLKAMLMDGDTLTRANAAVGLARNGVADAADALLELIEENLAEVDRRQFQKLSDEEQKDALASRQFVRPTVLRTCARAACAIHESMHEQKSIEFVQLLRKLSADSDPSVSMEAKALLVQIHK